MLPLTFFCFSIAQTQRAIDRLAWHYASVGLGIKSKNAPVQVIAILASSAIDETLLEIALTKLGLTGLLLSVNNSVPAIAHLCKLTAATHLIYGDKFVQAAADARKLLSAEGHQLGLVPDKRFPLWGPGGVDEDVNNIRRYPVLLTPDEEMMRPAVILHSSGSVGGLITILTSGA
jgi:hypothetical protein